MAAPALFGGETTDLAGAEALPLADVSDDVADPSTTSVPIDDATSTTARPTTTASALVEDSAELVTTPSSSDDSAAILPSRTSPVPPGGSLVASSVQLEGDIPVWGYPGDLEPAWQIPAVTEFGGSRVFLVLEERAEWVKVSLPVRPNGSEGWLPKDEVVVSNTDFKVRIFLSDRTFEVWKGDELVLDTTPAVGNGRAPTPIGNWFIRDIFPWNAESVYGPYVLALSAYSESIDQINGGDAVVAIHGTNRPDLLGQAVSLGCIRLSNSAVTELANTVPVGTPVEIVA